MSWFREGTEIRKEKKLLDERGERVSVVYKREKRRVSYQVKNNFRRKGKYHIDA